MMLGHELSVPSWPFCLCCLHPASLYFYLPTSLKIQGQDLGINFHRILWTQRQLQKCHLKWYLYFLGHHSFCKYVSISRNVRVKYCWCVVITVHTALWGLIAILCQSKTDVESLQSILNGFLAIPIDCPAHRLNYLSGPSRFSSWNTVSRRWRESTDYSCYKLHDHSLFTYAVQPEILHRRITWVLI